MKQFINGSDVAFQDLEERAKYACIRFKAQEMPPNCSPRHANIGFDINPDNNAAKLWVSLGIGYRGNNSEIQQWLAVGYKEFSSFSELKKWICGPLADEYQNGASESGYVPYSDTITDMRVVQEAVKKINKPVYLNEEELFKKLSQKVRGQDTALKSLSTVMTRHLARRQPKRPAVLFAIGPTGVGKTRSAEVLAEALRGMGTEDAGYQFLRLDMTEYQEAHRVSQLIGAPQGYIGHGEGSQLVDSLRANPRTIVLFDEIEKAHPNILKTLMNTMDSGRLSTASRSNSGHEVDCRLSVFIFTSNINSKEILDELTTRNAFGNRAKEDEVCRRRLYACGIASEIVGRIGRFLVFQPLSTETRAEIIAVTITEIADEYGVKVSYVAPSVIIDLLKRVGSQNFGVRPERYVIDDLLGGEFIKAAMQNFQNPVQVIGPPFQCVPGELELLESQENEKSVL